MKNPKPGTQEIIPPAAQSAPPTIGGCNNPPAVIRTLIDHSANGGPVLDVTEDLAKVTALQETSEAPPTNHSIASDGFNWDGEDVVLHHQRKIAIYENNFRNIVIRGEADYPDEDEDPFFVITREAIPRVIKKLREFA